MLRLIMLRTAAAVPIMLIVITVSFVLMRMAPGGPFDGARNLSPAVERNLKAHYDMNRPPIEQYVAYVKGVLRGDLGPSIKYPDKSVSDILFDSFPKSALLGSLALLLVVSLGIGMGLVTGLADGGWLARIFSAGTLVMISVPAFVSAPLLILLFASRLGWLPMGGWGGASQLVLPVIVLALPPAGVIARLTALEMRRTMGSDFIRSARARGLSDRRIVLRYAMPSALIPIISYLGPTCAALLAGSMVVEQMFSLPGMGRHFVNGALQRDYPLAMGVVIVGSALTLLFNLLADISLALLAPHTRKR